MKIVFILTYYRPHWTGLTQYAARLAEGLAEKGHLVEVLCCQHDKKLPEYEEISGVKVHRLPYLFRFLRSVVSPSFPYHLWKKVREVEAVVVYLPLQEVPLVALFARFFKKKLFLVHNGDLVLPKNGGWMNRLVEKLYFLMTAFAIKLSSGVVIQTEDYAENSKLLAGLKNKWRVILPLYEIPKISTKEIRDFKKKHHLEGKILIGFSGRFVEEKGVDFLLTAIPQVIKKIPRAHFVFAGDYKIKYEKFYDRIKPLIQKNREYITLLGLLPDQKQVFTFYRAIDLLIQPSRTDCFPSSQIEALLAGTPSVCSNIPGARWVVKQTAMGFLVEPGNPQSLAKGIINGVKNRRQLLKGRGKVKEIFDYQKTLSDYEQLLRQG